MSFGGLILTNEGRNKIAAAISSEKALDFTHVQLGDGTFNGSYSSKKELTHIIMEIPVTRVTRRDNEVAIDCDWNSSQAPEGFYFREIGIIGNGALCYYDNAGTGDAEYIDPGSEVVTKEKRIRLTVVVSDDAHVTVHTASNLYALATEVEVKLNELNEQKVDETELHSWARQPEKPSYSKMEVGLGNVDNTADKDKPVSAATQAALDLFYANANQFTLNKIAELVNGAPATMDTLKEIADVIAANKSVVDALNAAIGSKASQAELDTHVNNNNIHFTASERQQLGSLVSQFGSKANAIAPLGCSTLPSNLLSYCSKFGLSYSSTLGYYNLYSEFSDNLNTQFVTAAGTGYRIEKSGYYNLRIQATITGSCSATSAVKRTGIRVGSNTGSWLLQALGRLQTWESLNDSSDVHLGAGTILVPIFQMDSNGSTVTTATVDVVMRILPLFIKN